MKEEDKLSVMRKRLTMAISAVDESRESEMDDLRFFAGNPDNQFQWPSSVLSTRGSVQGQSINARPCLTINKLPQHVKQVTNDQRQNRPAGKVIPVDDKADVKVAEIYGGIVRHIESISDVDVCIDTACESQVAFGEGYWRLVTEYCDDNSFDQDIRYKRIRNSFSVFMDPMIQDPCGSDAEWCFIMQQMLKEDFEREFPDAKPMSSLEYSGIGDADMALWMDDNTVKVAEYFYTEYDTKTLNLYPGGITVYSDDPTVKLLGKPLKTRSVKNRKIKWCKTNGFEFFDVRDWAGKWIPVIRVVGNEFDIEGRLHISGIVRNAKDAQRLYNYWVSQEAEMLALAPKAPFIGYGGQFEGYEEQWKTANINNWPYLEVNRDATDGQGNPLPLPQRAAPPLPQAGLIQAKMGASDDIKSTTGQYDASLGAEANERSGKAIIARERQTDTGTYHYVDNLARAVRHSTRQIVDLIPKIYDTKRIARIIGIDGEPDHAEIDPEQQQPVVEVRDQQTNAIIKTIYNPSIGTYDVCVTTGPSYMTKRQAAMDAMQQILSANPALWQVAGDIFAKNMDWPGAEELAERLKKTIDPKLLADDEDPVLAAAQQQIQQMGQEMDQMHQMLMNIQSSFEAQKAHLEAKKADHEEFSGDIAAYNAETQRMAMLTKMASPEELQILIRKTMQEMMAAPPLEEGPLEEGGGPPPTMPEMQPTQQPANVGFLTHNE